MARPGFERFYRGLMARHQHLVLAAAQPERLHQVRELCAGPGHQPVTGYIDLPPARVAGAST